MKYPYDLSEQRLSLLSKEEQALYRYEHSDYYSFEEKEEAYNLLKEARNISHFYWLQKINEEQELADLNDIEKFELANDLSDAEFDEDVEMILEMIDEDFSEICNSNEEKEKIMQEFRTYVKSVTSAEPLNEDTPGPDMTWFLQGLDKPLKLALGAGIAGLVGLIAAGKDKWAEKKLEKYMNKLVEMTDDGINKKQVWWSRFTERRTENRGDQSSACFRDFQELVQRDELKSLLVLAKNCGYLGDDPINEAASQNYSGGLFTKSAFKGKISDKIDIFIK